MASGHDLDVRNLLTEHWTSEELQKFFGNRPVDEWLNPSNPLVKSGELNPGDYEPLELLDMMVENPLLIARPLMQIANERLAGFDVQEVHNWIGLELESIGERDPKHCPCVIKS